MGKTVGRHNPNGDEMEKKKLLPGSTTHETPGYRCNPAGGGGHPRGDEKVKSFPFFRGFKKNEQNPPNNNPSQPPN